MRRGDMGNRDLQWHSLIELGHRFNLLHIHPSERPRGPPRRCLESMARIGCGVVKSGPCCRTWRGSRLEIAGQQLVADFVCIWWPHFRSKSARTLTRSMLLLPRSYRDGTACVVRDRPLGIRRLSPPVPPKRSRQAIALNFATRRKGRLRKIAQVLRGSKGRDQPSPPIRAVQVRPRRPFPERPRGAEPRPIHGANRSLVGARCGVGTLVVSNKTAVRPMFEN